MTLIPVFDGHNDTLTHLYLPERGRGRSFFQRSESGHIDLPRAREGGLIGGIFAIFTPPPQDSPEHDPRYGATITEDGYYVEPHSPLDYAYASRFTGSVLDFLAQLEAEAEGVIGLVRSWPDLERNLHDGTLSVVLHFEGAEAIQRTSATWRSTTRKGCARWVSPGAAPTPLAAACHSGFLTHRTQVQG
jgi:membrane dipeptidase